MKPTVFFALLPLLVLGCGKNDPAPADFANANDAKKPTIGGKELFPLAVGNQWVYSVTVNGKADEMTLKVLKVATKGTETIASVSSVMSSGKPHIGTWKVTKNGIYQVSVNEKDRFTPPQLAVPFPLDDTAAKKFKANGPVPTGGKSEQSVVIRNVGIQEIDTESGRMSAYAVESVTSWKGAALTSTSWWAPQVGFVRQRQVISSEKGSIEILMRLKSYSFP